MNTMILVNAHHPCPEQSRDLVPVRPGSGVLLEREAASWLNLLMAGLDGWRYITPVSGYRSQKEQQIIWDTSLAENGAEFTARYVAHPGHSEHQTGLAIDLGRSGPELDFLRPDFPYEGICQEFRVRAPAFGFVERYPEGKQAVTGIAHEPWHFRYVGTPHARIMTRLGLTLEEYLAREERA